MPQALTTLVLLSILGKGSAIGMDGRIHYPIREALGTPTAFIFVTHDCPICNSYAPEIKRIELKFRSKANVQLVYSDPLATVHRVQSHAKEYGLQSLTKWVDRSRTLAFGCGASVVPQAVVFDSKGHKTWSGRIDDQYVSLGVRKHQASTHDLRDAIDSVVKGQSPKAALGQPVGCIILTPGTS